MLEPPQQVAAGVHRFSDASVNWYALDDGDGLVLVDCGWPGSRGVLVAGLKAIGRTPADVRAVLLTHAHPDHIGSARWLSSKHGAPVYAHADELERIRAGRDPHLSPIHLARELWRPTARRFLRDSLRRGGFRPEWPHAARSLDAAAALPRGLTRVPTPGHTEGHVAYHLSDRGIVLSGDSLVTVDILTGRRGPRLHPIAFQQDIDAAVHSLTALAGVDATLVLPGHGDPYHGRVSVAVEHALEASKRP